jgi:hypothetical protein
MVNITSLQKSLKQKKAEVKQAKQDMKMTTAEGTKTPWKLFKRACI